MIHQYPDDHIYSGNFFRVNNVDKMKIEKGKLYYNKDVDHLFKADRDMIWEDHISNKIAVHCPTKEDWEYVRSKGFYLGRAYVFENYYYDLYCKDFGDLKNFDIIITIDQFKEFYPPISNEEQDPYVWGSIDISNKTNDNNPISPTHYNQYDIQPLDYIEANGFDFCEGNVIKYVSRYKQKNGLEDLKKARVYLDKLINRYER